jgi:hypothetical protein
MQENKQGELLEDHHSSTRETAVVDHGSIFKAGPTGFLNGLHMSSARTKNKSQR